MHRMRRHLKLAQSSSVLSLSYQLSPKLGEAQSRSFCAERISKTSNQRQRSDQICIERVEARIKSIVARNNIDFRSHVRKKLFVCENNNPP